MPANKLFRECEHCGSRYEVRRYWQKFCSPACKKEHESKERKEAFSLYRAGQKKGDPTE